MFMAVLFLIQCLNKCHNTFCSSYFKFQVKVAWNKIKYHAWINKLVRWTCLSFNIMWMQPLIKPGTIVLTCTYLFSRFKLAPAFVFFVCFQSVSWEKSTIRYQNVNRNVASKLELKPWGWNLLSPKLYRWTLAKDEKLFIFSHASKVCFISNGSKTGLQCFES